MTKASFVLFLAAGNLCLTMPAAAMTPHEMAQRQAVEESQKLEIPIYQKINRVLWKIEFEDGRVIGGSAQNEVSTRSEALRKAFAMEAQKIFDDARVPFGPLIPGSEPVSKETLYLHVRIYQKGPQDPKKGSVGFNSNLQMPGFESKTTMFSDNGIQYEITWRKIEDDSVVLRMMNSVSGADTDEIVVRYAAEFMRELVYYYKQAHGARVLYSPLAKRWSEYSWDEKYLYLIIFAGKFNFNPPDFLLAPYIEAVDQAIMRASLPSRTTVDQVLVKIIEERFGEDALIYKKGQTDIRIIKNHVLVLYALEPPKPKMEDDTQVEEKLDVRFTPEKKRIGFQVETRILEKSDHGVSGGSGRRSGSIPLPLEVKPDKMRMTRSGRTYKLFLPLAKPRVRE